MKIVVVGTHSSQTTGYSRVMRGLVPELARLCDDVRVFGIQSFPGIPSAFQNEFDARAAENPPELGFGFGVLTEYLESQTPDAVVLYNDPVVLGEYVKRIAAMKNPPPVFLYVDLVYKNMYTQHWALFRHPLVRGIFAMSECWKRELQRIPGCKTVHIASHAVNVRPVPNARDVLRVHTDHVVYFNPNRNTHRKRGDLFVAAAARIVAADPDVKMSFLMNSHHEAAYDLRDIAIREFVAYRNHTTDADVHKLLDRLVINTKQLSDDDVWTVCSASDVIVTCSDGEGFGLCAAEGAALGKAVIVSAVGGAMDLFCPIVPTGRCPVYLLSPKATYYTDGRDGIGGYAEVIDTNDLVTAMLFFEDEESRSEYGERAKNFMDHKPTWADIARGMTEFMGGVVDVDPPLNRDTHCTLPPGIRA